jgi:hypothetical protein
MHEDGLGSIEPLVASGRIYNFLGNNRESKPYGWYMACEGVSKDGIPYFRCIYGSLNKNERHEYQSWGETVVLSKRDVKELDNVIEIMSTYLGTHLTDFMNDFRDRFLVDKKTLNQSNPIIELNNNFGREQRALIMENISDTNKTSQTVDDEPLNVLIEPELNLWVEFLNRINNPLLKSIFSNAGFLGSRDNCVSIKLANNSNFFQGKILEFKNIWNPIFQNIFPSMELIIKEVR